MGKHFFDYEDGDFAHTLSDNMAIDSDGDMLMRMGDNMAMDMKTGDLHFISQRPCRPAPSPAHCQMPGDEKEDTFFFAGG